MSAQPIPTDLIAVPIREAARLVGVSRVQFFKRYVWTGVVPVYDLGGRGKSVKLAELRAVVEATPPAQARDEKRAERRRQKVSGTRP